MWERGSRALPCPAHVHHATHIILLTYNHIISSISYHIISYLLHINHILNIINIISSVILRQCLQLIYHLTIHYYNIENTIPITGYHFRPYSLHTPYQSYQRLSVHNFLSKQNYQIRTCTNTQTIILSVNTRILTLYSFLVTCVLCSAVHEKLLCVRIQLRLG